MGTIKFLIRLKNVASVQQKDVRNQFYRLLCKMTNRLCESCIEYPAEVRERSLEMLHSRSLFVPMTGAQCAKVQIMSFSGEKFR